MPKNVQQRLKSVPPTQSGSAAVPSENLDALVAVLDAIRRDEAHSRPDIMSRTGLGRAVVGRRVADLLDRGLVIEDGLRPSSGGRAPRGLRLNADGGRTLLVDLGATSVAVGIADLAGRIITHEEEPGDITRGPEVILGRVETLLDGMIAKLGVESRSLWGIGIGVPGPVEFATGRPISPPIMPGWDRYPVRDRFALRYEVPVWVDNDANLMALAEHRAGVALEHRDAIFIKVGSGIGAGLLVDGRLHRGAQGSAGDVGHIQVSDDQSIVCRCGNVGCLEALAGGTALARIASVAAADGRSPALAGRQRGRSAVDVADVGWTAAHGDPFSVELIAKAGRLTGRMIATLVNALNPSLVIVGGGVAGLGDTYLAAIRQTVYERSLPLATRDLQIVGSSIGGLAGLTGAAHMVADELFARSRIARWLHAGTPHGRPEVAFAV